MGKLGGTVNERAAGLDRKIPLRLWNGYGEDEWEK